MRHIHTTFTSVDLLRRGSREQQRCHLNVLRSDIDSHRTRTAAGDQGESGQRFFSEMRAISHGILLLLLCAAHIGADINSSEAGQDTSRRWSNEFDGNEAAGARGSGTGGIGRMMPRVTVLLLPTVLNDIFFRVVYFRCVVCVLRLDYIV